MWAGVEKAASDYVLYARSRVRQNGIGYAEKMIDEERARKWIKDNRWKYKLTDEEFEQAIERAMLACESIYKNHKRDIGEQPDLL